MSSLPSTAQALRAELWCRLRPGVTERFAIRGAEAVIGREPGLTVSIPVEGVSRRHARLRFDGKDYWLDGLSPAGTFKNGRLVHSVKLAHLDVITLGKSVELLFRLRRHDEQARVVTEGIVRAALRPEGPDATPIEVPLGELSLGRSSANNVVAEHGAVSKMHARIQRTADRKSVV